MLHPTLLHLILFPTFILTLHTDCLGMDYPDVTFVLQMGSTTKEQYTHRLGRTARAGKEGSGLLLCAPFEMSALQRDLRDMPLVVAEPPVLAGEVSTSHNHTSHSQSLLFTYPSATPLLHSPHPSSPHLPFSHQVSDTRSRANQFAQKQSEPHMLELAELAWGAWLGYYNSQQVGTYTLSHVILISYQHTLLSGSVAEEQVGGAAY